MNLIEQLQQRDLVAQYTHPEELNPLLVQQKITLYSGFDPTADSMHVGHLMPLLGLLRFQKAGHRVIFLLGGGTGLIGDPTGKTDMRQMLTEELLLKNCESIYKQASQYLDLKSSERGLVLNNLDWLKGLNYLELLREVGVHFSVNRMLTAECFKQRLETGLSFLEFNYMILQSYDFLHLHKKFNCQLQIGGDDQWSNILAGVELIRRLSQGAKAFCLTFPLLTTSDGRKMGKTEKGAVWLDPNKTSPYEFYQYWRNVDDNMVGKCLRYFTFKPIEEITELEKLQGAQINQAKEILAHEMTALIHGKEEADKSQSAAKSFFTGGLPVDAQAITLKKSDFNENKLNILDFLLQSGVAPSKAEARRLLEQGGIAINDQKVNAQGHMVQISDFKSEQASEEPYLVLRKGKKHFYKISIV